MSSFTHTPYDQASILLIKSLIAATSCDITPKALKQITGFKLPVEEQLGMSNPNKFVYLPQLVLDVKTYSDKLYRLSEVKDNLELSYILNNEVTTETLYEDLGFKIYGELTFGNYRKITYNEHAEPQTNRQEPTINYDAPFAVLVATVKTKHKLSDTAPRHLLTREVTYTLLVNTVSYDTDSVMSQTLKAMHF